MSKFFTEQSKLSWEPLNGGEITTEHLIIGCLQRIAAATEAMAKNYVSLQNDVDWYKRRYKELSEDKQKSAKRIAAYQGHIKRMKKPSTK